MDDYKWTASICAPPDKGHLAGKRLVSLNARIKGKNYHVGFALPMVLPAADVYVHAQQIADAMNALGAVYGQEWKRGDMLEFAGG